MEERPSSALRGAVYEKGFFNDAVRLEMYDGSSLELKGHLDPEAGGHEFTDAVNTFVATGQLPEYLQPFR